MWVAVFIVAALAVAGWFVRTPLFRAHLRHGKDPGDAGTRVEGRFPTNGGDYYHGEHERRLE